MSDDLKVPEETLDLLLKPTKMVSAYHRSLGVGTCDPIFTLSLRYFLRARDMSATEFSRRSGKYSKSSVSNWVRGDNWPRAQAWEIACRIFNVSRVDFVSIGQALVDLGNRLAREDERKALLEEQDMAVAETFVANLSGKKTLALRTMCDRRLSELGEDHDTTEGVREMKEADLVNFVREQQAVLAAANERLKQLGAE